MEIKAHFQLINLQMVTIVLKKLKERLQRSKETFTKYPQKLIQIIIKNSIKNLRLFNKNKGKKKLYTIKLFEKQLKKLKKKWLFRRNHTITIIWLKEEMMKRKKSQKRRRKRKKKKRKRKKKKKKKRKKLKQKKHQLKKLKK